MELTEKAINLDGALCSVAKNACNSKEMITDALCYILFCSDRVLKPQIVAYYMYENENIELLLETDSSFSLHFQMNKDLKPRMIMGDALFKEAVEITATQFSRTKDYQNAIALYDKVLDKLNVFKVMVLAYVDRKRPSYFCNAELYGIPEAWQPLPRPKDVFNTIMSKVDPKKLDPHQKELFDLVQDMDSISRAFDMLSVGGDKITKELMQGAMSILDTL